jgi:pyroglutamyl-peptidase
MHGTGATEPTVIVTGFEPFDRWTTNPSQLIAKELDGENIGSCTVAGLILPVDYAASVDALVDAIARHPSIAAVICVGLNGAARHIEVERLGCNLMREGWCVSRIGSGPFFRQVTVPVSGIVQAIGNENIPVRYSWFAGMYACNHLLYRLLEYCEKNALDVSVGFIHVPPLPEQRSYGIPLADAVAAVRIAVQETIS